MSILKNIDFSSSRTLPVYMQSEVAECGLACLAMISTYHGHSLSVAEARSQFLPSQKGASLTELMSVANALDLTPKAVKLDLPALPDLPLPAIVHWDFNHFVVLAKVEAHQVRIHDPALGERTMPIAEFSKHFTGVALQLKPNDDFKPRDASPLLKVRDLLGKVRGFGSALGQVLFFALLLECIGLAMPLMGQLIADEVLPNSDASLLVVLAIGFTLLVILRSVINFTRDWALSLIALGLKAQVSERVFRHALRLPPEFFERRRSADIASRFDSLSAIERTLAGSFIETLLDGLFSLVIVALLFSYSAKLGAIVAGTALLYAIIRTLAFRPMREQEMRIVEAHSRQNASLLETLRAIVPLQLANKTPWRFAQWGIHLAEGTNADLRLARANALLNGSRALTLGVGTVLFSWAAASLALDGTLSLGAVFAVLAYQQTVSGRLNALVERVMSIRMLSVHLERLSDIVHAAPLPKDSVTVPPVGEGPITITVQDVHFRYSPSEPEILSGVSLTVNAGEHVALTGASGCGKTTLMKLMLGILKPTSGQVLFNGRPLAEFGVENQRAITAAVLQDDTLFYGTIKDNISYFDPLASDEKVAKAASLAGIHQEILTMPLGYLSLVGEGNGALSGGQRQRVLLARAIYREPRLLLLDEATSHLDLQNEALVNQGIASLQSTRVSVAHRPETLLAAQRIIAMHGGRIVQEFTSAQFLEALRGQRPPPGPVKS